MLPYLLLGILGILVVAWFVRGESSTIQTDATTEETTVEETAVLDK